MLHKWNKSMYNPTSVRDPNEMLVRFHTSTKHSRCAISSGTAFYRRRNRTGAAGIPTGYCSPDAHFTLPTKLGQKRVRFLRQVQHELKSGKHHAGSKAALEAYPLRNHRLMALSAALHR
ncbi:hypothetical protein KCP70_11590 [Salmonella enterica subsp. enterica]|nr:hypothetical protein KCP70_11590 [Salmonella enterica subsp. enterica]